MRRMWRSSAFDSFCRRAERGQFPRLEDREDLWQVLFVLTVRKAIDHARHESRAIRAPVECARWRIWRTWTLCI